MKYLGLVCLLVVMEALVGCGEDVNSLQSSKGKGSEVFQQNPGPHDIIVWPEKINFHKKNIIITSEEDYLRIEDNKKNRVGWALWVLENIPPNQDYNITIKINKGYDKDQYSQIQIKFLVNQTQPAKYFYLFLPDRGKIIAQKQATKDMASIVDKGDYWQVKLQTKSPDNSSSMQFMVFPAVGKKIPIGVLEIRSIEVIKRS